MKDLLEECIPLGCRNYGLKCFVIAGVFCVLWNTRNKMAIEGVFIKLPTDILFKLDTILQRWGVLLREADRVILDGSGPYLRTCGPCDCTGLPNLKGPQNIRYTLDIVM